MKFWEVGGGRWEVGGGMWDVGCGVGRSNNACTRHQPMPRKTALFIRFWE